MESINDTLLQEVLFCDKVAIRADRKKLSFANRHRRNNIYLVSENGKYEYKFYLRQSEDFLEDFSVGLIWTNPANDYHIHTITLDDFKDKRYQKPSGRVLTSAFSSFEQAIFYLINEYKVKNVESVVELPEEVDQTTLFEEV